MGIIGWTYAIVTIGIAIWIYYDAKKRDYESFHAFLWTLGALWFGFIALILWLIIRPKYYSEDAEMCRSCRNFFEGDPAVCPYCGVMLKEEAVDLSYQDFDNLPDN